MKVFPTHVHWSESWYPRWQPTNKRRYIARLFWFWRPFKFEGFSDKASDINIPEASSSSENEDSSSESERENEDKKTENLRGVRVEPFTENTGAVFSDDFDVATASAKDIFFLDVQWGTNCGI